MYFYVHEFTGRAKSHLDDEHMTNFNISEEDLEDEKGGEEAEEKKTFKEKLQAVQDVTALVQNALGLLGMALF